MEILAWVEIALVALGTVVGPYFIGKPKKPPTYTAAWYVGSRISSAAIVAVCGRVLGWW